MSLESLENIEPNLILQFVNSLEYSNFSCEILSIFYHNLNSLIPVNMITFAKMNLMLIPLHQYHLEFFLPCCNTITI
jgi:hypothetical protein